MTAPRIVACLAVFAASPVFAAEGGGETFTTPAAGGPDFAIQGEYTGEGSAAQVVALGDGKFRIVGWTPGLPGTSDELEKKMEGDAMRQGEKVVFDTEGWKGEIVGDTLTGTNKDGKSYTLKKTERKSPTLGAKPPQGAVVLFDGSNADAWQRGKVTPEGLLAAGTKSKQEFGDCTLHVEFRTPFMPKARGQARGNSGVYLQDRFEVQVLDSFGLKGEDNECGGIYSKHKPRVNMCLPPLSWQTYDIDFTAARYDAEGKRTSSAKISVKHNGVVIHENAELSGQTTAAGRKEGPGMGPIQLQDHGNPVVFRNIWVVPK